MAETHFTLNTGAKIPSLGYGTWQAPPGVVKEAVVCALKAGYTHIDCGIYVLLTLCRHQADMKKAYCYGNEDEVGAGFKEVFASGIKREDLFITTKLWCTYHTRVEVC